MTEPTNPYAPPSDTSSLSGLPHDWLAGRLWQLGNFMVIGNGAELRPRCFLSGEETDTAVRIRASWLPNWVYLLLLFGIFPYFVVAPFFRRHISLNVPVTKRILQTHRKRVRTAALLILACTCAVVVAQYQTYRGPESPLVIVVAVVLIVFVLGRDPVRLQIVRIDNNVLILRKLPPRCVEGLPTFGAGETEFRRNMTAKG